MADHTRSWLSKQMVSVRFLARQGEAKSSRKRTDTICSPGHCSHSSLPLFASVQSMNVLYESDRLSALENGRCTVRV